MAAATARPVSAGDEPQAAAVSAAAMAVHQCRSDFYASQHEARCTRPKHLRSRRTCNRTAHVGFHVSCSHGADGRPLGPTPHCLFNLE